MNLLTPPEMVKELDRTVVGQERAKRALAVAIRNRWRAERAGICDHDDPGKHRFLVAGPRGAGKSSIVRSAARAAGAPFAQINAFQLAASGPSGRTVRAVMDALVNQAACRLAEDRRDLALRDAGRAGIILIDGLDRWPSGTTDDEIEVVLRAAQQALYELASSPSFPTRSGDLPAPHILMFATGLVTSGRPADIPSDLQALFPGRIELDALGEDDLHHILSNPEASPVHAYVALLASEGLRVDFTPDALTAVAREANELNHDGEDLGARRLVAVIETVLDDLLYDPDSAPQREITIDAAYVTGRLVIEGEDEDLDDFIL